MLRSTLPDIILVAVSGGSDSLALLYRLADQNIIAATVDHGLRPEATEEAAFVTRICQSLNIPHTVLTWQPDGLSAQAARIARYQLLVDHAKKRGATTIALGHTLDDQAETVMMRAFRAKPDSGTRGMSGMTECAHYDDVKLWRPLLQLRRQILRDELEAQDIEWIEDPSNDKLSSERVRIRSVLNVTNGLPTHEQIGQFAHLSGRSRQWLNNKTSDCIDRFARFDGETWHLKPETRSLPRTLLIDVFSTLIFVSGNMPFRPSIKKFEDLVDAFRSVLPLRKAVGRSLINIRKDGVQIKPENRNGLIKNNGSLAAFEKFRPSIDDAVYSAVRSKMAQKSKAV